MTARYLSCLTSYPGLPPRLYLAAVEKSCEIKSGWRPGYEVSLAHSGIEGEGT